MKLGRSRTLRGNVSPLPGGDSPGREPFCLGPFRQQKGFPVPSPTLRRTRANGENVPPDNNHTAAYVKAQSPDHSKSSRKARNGGAALLPGSPALLPRPPSTKPSPAGSTAPLSAADNLSAAKRKLSWDASAQQQQLNDNIASTVAAVDSSDSGVKVILRIRPLNSREKQEEDPQIVRRISADTVCLLDQSFTYDEVAAEGHSQKEIFDMIGLPVVEHCLAGFNSSIFAYGQTGTGKTHTMMGVVTNPGSSLPLSDERGLIPRAFETLFSRIQQEEKTHSGKGLIYQCRCSFLEIYNEQITDLLEHTRKNLQIREDTNRGVYVDSLSEEFVSNGDDVSRLLLKGLSNRRTGVTLMNNESSRSHSVFTCVIESRFKNFAAGGNSVRRSRMNLVDLAGSERQKLTGTAGERLKEAGNINKSLSQLGNVINTLAEVAQTGKMRHIPYRDSRLTFLLQESLGGNAKLAMICAVSPAQSCRSETLSTLRFAQRAKVIQNRAVVNEETADDVGFLREQIRQLKDELKRMKSNGDQDTGANGYSNGWNARRSYNLLRLSLNHPMTMATSELADTDLEMDIDDDEDEPEDKLASSVARESVREVLARLPAIDESDSAFEEVSMDMDVSSSVDGIHCGDLKLSSSPAEVVSKRSDTEPVPMSVVDGLNKMEKLMGIQDLMIPQILHSPILHSPPLSVSPRLTVTARRSFTGSPMGLPPQVAAACDVPPPGPSMSEEVYHSTQERFVEDSNSSKSPQSKRESSPSLSAVRASSVTSRPTEKLAASLHRGLQILDNHNRSSVTSLRQSAAAFQFSNLRSDCQLPRIVDKFDKGVQTSSTVLVSTSTSPTLPTTLRLSLHEKISSCNLHLCLTDDSLPNSIPEDTISAESMQEKFVLCIDPSGTPLVELSDSRPPSDSASKDFSGGLVEGLSNVELSESCPPSDPASKDFSRGLVEDLSNVELSESFPPSDSGSKDFSGGLVKDLSNVDLSESCPPSDSASKVFSGSLLEDSSNESQLQLVLCPDSPGDRPSKLNNGHLDLSPRNWVQDLQSGHVQLSQSPLLERSLASELEQHRSKDGSSLNYPGSTSSPSQWQLVPHSASNGKEATPAPGLGNSSQFQIVQAVEAVLAGAIRREHVAEEETRKQAAEIEQLNRLVRQYKHERECNAILHQTRENKIARLEFLVDNAIPTDAYLNEEWSALLLENRLLQEKFDNHPEVTQSSLEKQRLVDELHRYRNFFDLGEREILLEEITSLRNQLQSKVESSGLSPSPRQRCAPPRMSLQVASFNDGRLNNSSAALVATPSRAQSTSRLSESSADLSMVIAGEVGCEEQPDAVEDAAAPAERIDNSQSCEEEKRGLDLGRIDTSQSWEEEKQSMELEWKEREGAWMAALDELREEVESYRRQAEKSKQEVDGEKRCSEEMQEALQMAMTGHARLLEQYAELQEKHLNLLAKQRKIKEGFADVKKMAKKSGVTSLESRWLETQALQLAALRVEYEEEKARSKGDIEDLQAQLRDTAEAVQAAGELLVRLKEAEESVTMAQDAEEMANQNAGGLRRELERIRRRHATEVSVLQQRLLESRLHKTAVCPMCVMAERVKFQFNEGVEDEDVAEQEEQQQQQQTSTSHFKQELDENWGNSEALSSSSTQQQFEDRCNYESEILGAEEEGRLDELQLNEFDELDHLLTGSTTHVLV